MVHLSMPRDVLGLFVFSSHFLVRVKGFNETVCAGTIKIKDV